MYRDLALDGTQLSEYSYTLNCYPASGTLIEPAQACEAINQNPNMVLGPAKGRRRECEAASPTLGVSGLYDGEQIGTTFSECGDPAFALWHRFLPATFIVHVTEEGGLCQTISVGNGKYEEKCPAPEPDETQPLRISRLGPNREVLQSIETDEHTIHVAPGEYEIATVGAGGSAAIKTVEAGQEQEIKFTVFIR